MRHELAWGLFLSQLYCSKLLTVSFLHHIIPSQDCHLHGFVGLGILGTQRSIRLLCLAGKLRGYLVASPCWANLIGLHHALEGEQLCFNIVLVGKAVEFYSLAVGSAMCSRGGTSVSDESLESIDLFPHASHTFFVFEFPSSAIFRYLGFL